jgi:hypothetical protein
LIISNCFCAPSSKRSPHLGEKCLGFIAEEVPDLVAMNDRKSLSTMDIVAVLTKVVKEQQKLNQEQQNELSLLKAKLSVLEEKLTRKKKN